MTTATRAARPDDDTDRDEVVVTAVGVVAGTARTAGALLDPGTADDAVALDPADIVGRRGLRYKDRATALAWCAADLALRDAGLVTDSQATVGTEHADRIGVVASSNLGNADTVVSAMSTIHAETVAGTSPMDLPNASSNVVASSVAIRYGLRGPNMMICNGAPSGLDALRWARLLVRSGRADGVLVVGVEPATDVSRAVHACDHVFDGAAAVLVESATAARVRGARVLATLGRYARHGTSTTALTRVLGSGSSRPDLFLTPDDAFSVHPSTDLTSARRVTLGDRFGRTSGALGVLQCATAVGHISRGGGAVLALAGADGGDAAAAMMFDPVAVA